MPPQFAGVRVIYPLMPKGVEHWRRAPHLAVVDYVIYPLMPKGVEHMLTKNRNEKMIE